MCMPRMSYDDAVGYSAKIAKVVLEKLEIISDFEVDETFAHSKIWHFWSVKIQPQIIEKQYCTSILFCTTI